MYMLCTSSSCSPIATTLKTKFFLFFLIFYLCIHERQREREAETQAEAEAGSLQEPDAGLDPGTRGHALSHRQMLLC